MKQSNSRSIAERIDPERTETLLSKIAHHELPSVVDELVTDYQLLAGARPPFMWKWVHRLAPKNTLPCIDPEYAEKTAIDKTLTILYITLLDDVLEKTQDNATFQAIAQLPTTNQLPETPNKNLDTEYATFAERVWKTLLDRLQRAPNFERYAPLFRFDIKQAINAIEYSYLIIQHPSFASVTDVSRYESHNMGLYSYADIDFMHTSDRIDSDFPALRNALWHAQQMSRIGNWVSTWRRELTEGDYSSGIVVYALENGIVSKQTIRRCESDSQFCDRIIDRIEDERVEDVFLTKWDTHLESMQKINNEELSMDLTPFMEGLREILRYHLSTTGLK